MPYERDRITQDDVLSACESVRENGNVHHLHRDHGQTRFTVAIRYGDFGHSSGKDVWWIDDNQADDRDKAFHSDDIFVVIEYVRAFLNQEPLRYGAVVVFPAGYTRQDAEKAISKISDHIDPFYYVPGEHGIERTITHGYDERDGGPVWYIP